MQITVRQLEPRTVVGIRTPTSLATIGDDIGRLTGQLEGIVGDRATGPVMVRYHTWEGDRGELEVMLPVAGEVANDLVGERVQASTLPACRAAVGVHEGPYEGLAAAWGAVHAWIAENGHAPGVSPWEEYMADCSSVAPEDLRTTIFFPLG